MTDALSWQGEIRTLWEQGDHVGAAGRLRDRLLGGVPMHQVQELARFIERLDAPSGWTVLPLVALRTYTIEPLVPLLRVRCFADQILLEPHVAEFGHIEQAIHNERVPFEKARAVILFWRLEDVSPGLSSQFLRLGPEEIRGEIDAVTARFEAIVRRVRSRTAAYLALGGAFLLRNPHLGLADPTASPSQQGSIDELNSRLREIARTDGSTVLIDEDRWMGSASRFDPLMWTSARLPYAAPALDALARAHAAVLRAIAGRARKCVVLDLDNTLWKGVIGDDGIEGIGLDVTGEGLGFRELQAYLSSLKDRGILLAIASRNDRDTALGALRSHPRMLLREEDFAALEIHWEDKATSLRRIATRLNLGLDSIAYVDDSEFECGLVRREIPQVLTLCAPTPWAAIDLLESIRPFDSLTFTREDAARAEQYRGQIEREALKTSAASIDEFLSSLSMVVQQELVAPGHPAWQRVVQLINKTNQFNLTGERVTPEQLQEQRRAGGEIHAFTVRDRFGDNGVVAALVLSREGSRLTIPVFVMSCRVIGRRVEEAILAAVARRAAELGCSELVGRYRRTDRNSIVVDLYARLGFRMTDGDEVSGSWLLPLPATLEIPDVMRLVEGTGVHG